MRKAEVRSPCATAPGKGSARSVAQSGFSADYAELMRWRRRQSTISPTASSRRVRRRKARCPACPVYPTHPGLERLVARRWRMEPENLVSWLQARRQCETHQLLHRPSVDVFAAKLLLTASCHGSACLPTWRPRRRPPQEQFFSLRNYCYKLYFVYGNGDLHQKGDQGTEEDAAASCRQPTVSV
jgi:hypothetical protein